MGGQEEVVVEIAAVVSRGHMEIENDEVRTFLELVERKTGK